MRTRYFYVIYILLVVIILFLPLIFIHQKEIKAIDDDISKREALNNKTIKLLLSDTQKVIEIKLEDYIKGVVSAEMPATYEMEALKAQAVAARTYTINKINSLKHNGYADICDNSQCCQAYLSMNQRLHKWNENNENSLQLWDKIDEAVVSTQGCIITYNKEPIQAFFHANSGGITEDVSLVWNEENIPYLKSVKTQGENNYTQYSSEVIIDKKEFVNILKSKYNKFTIDFFDNNCIKILEISNSNRVQKIKIREC